MSTPHHYKQYVIGRNYTQGICVRNIVFKNGDSPKKWGMRPFQTPEATFWNIGFVSDLINEPTGRPSVVVETIGDSPYCFCRTRNWLPYWGKATKQHAELVKEIRAYWAYKWCTKTLPEMRKAIMDSTPIPEDVYDEHFANIFEYPYEIKSF